ncbi:MAG TPA: hypothetical protein VGY48_15755 [Vicinamibacterales bacterium]|jgi:hypothetical protein|nr:hypothetical protein [Vicinamibacterales bacterium]
MPRSRGGPTVKAVRRGDKIPLPDDKGGDVKERPAPFDGLYISTPEGCFMYIDAKSAWAALDDLID